MSDATVSDPDKHDGGPMRYLRHQRSRNRLQDEEPKTNPQKSSDGKNVNLLYFYKISIQIITYTNLHVGFAI